MTVTAMPTTAQTGEAAAPSPRRRRRAGKKKILIILVVAARRRRRRLLVLAQAASRAEAAEAGRRGHARPDPDQPGRRPLPADRDRPAADRRAAKEVDGSKALDATIDLFSGQRDRRGHRPAAAPRELKKELEHQLEERLRRRGDGGVLHRVRHASELSNRPRGRSGPRRGSPIRSGRARRPIMPRDRRRRPCTAVAAPRSAADVPLDGRGAVRLPAPDPALARALPASCRSRFDGFARQATTVLTSSLRTVCHGRRCSRSSSRPTPSTSTALGARRT